MTVPAPSSGEPPLSNAPPPSGRSLQAVRLVTALVALLLLMADFAGVLAPGPVTEKTTLVIAHGTNTRAIADQLADRHIIYSKVLFYIAARVMAANTLRAGEYAFTPGQSIADIVAMMHRGRVVMRKFTVAEGLTSADVLRLLTAAPALSGGIPATPPEGSLLPETYLYSYGDSRAGLIARMQRGMQTKLADLWQDRNPALPLKSPEEAVILASLVEKETGKPAERPRIAGVFYNRLRLHMRLQSDPTVIYGIVQAKGSMTHDIDHGDLAFPSPYNTYLNDGLPPHPICNPGTASLQAALHPEDNDYLYFVADGTGGHVFARNLAAHNRNVTLWRQERAGER